MNYRYAQSSQCNPELFVVACQSLVQTVESFGLAELSLLSVTVESDVSNARVLG